MIPNSRTQMGARQKRKDLAHQPRLAVTSRFLLPCNKGMSFSLTRLLPVELARRVSEWSRPMWTRCRCGRLHRAGPQNAHSLAKSAPPKRLARAAIMSSAE